MADNEMMTGYLAGKSDAGGNGGGWGCGMGPWMMGAGMGMGFGGGWGYGGIGEWIPLLFLAGIFGWGNGGWGFGGNNGQAGTLREEISYGFDMNGLENGVRGIQQGLCDGFYAVNTGMLNGFNGIQRDLCAGFGGVNTAITSLGYQMKDCCCEVNRNIDALRFENSRNTCEIVNALANTK